MEPKTEEPAPAPALVSLWDTELGLLVERSQRRELFNVDEVPFWTTERSGKLCGVRRDVNYEV